MTSPPASPSPSNVFSPVKVADSPCQSSRGNLTGTPRKVKDSVAELFNSIQKWNNLHADGLLALQRICSDLPATSGSSSREPQEDSERLERLQKKCDMAVEVVNKMAALVATFEQVHTHFLGLEKLDKLNPRAADVIFLTWPIGRYIDLSEALSASYGKQLALNVHVVENIAFGALTAANGLLALWTHQPFVEPVLSCNVEAALVETGFK